MLACDTNDHYTEDFQGTVELNLPPSPSLPPKQYLHASQLDFALDSRHLLGMCRLPAPIDRALNR